MDDLKVLKKQVEQMRQDTVKCPYSTDLYAVIAVRPSAQSNRRNGQEVDGLVNVDALPGRARLAVELREANGIAADWAQRVSWLSGSRPALFGDPAPAKEPRLHDLSQQDITEQSQPQGAANRAAATG